MEEKFNKKQHVQYMHYAREVQQEVVDKGEIQQEGIDAR